MDEERDDSASPDAGLLLDACEFDVFEPTLFDERQLLGLSDCERLEPLRPRRSCRVSRTLTPAGDMSTLAAAAAAFAALVMCGGRSS